MLQPNLKFITSCSVKLVNVIENESTCLENEYEMNVHMYTCTFAAICVTSFEFITKFIIT